MIYLTPCDLNLSSFTVAIFVRVPACGRVDRVKSILCNCLLDKPPRLIKFILSFMTSGVLFAVTEATQKDKHAEQ
jgi:hypothetical protein